MQFFPQPRQQAAVENALAPTGTEAMVCCDIATRQRHGVNKYGVSVADNPLNLAQWLQHAYEESLDFSVYLKRAISELGFSQSFTVTARNNLSGELVLTTEEQETLSGRILPGDRVVLLVMKKGA